MTTTTIVDTPGPRERSLRERLIQRRREVADELARDMAEVALAPDARGEDLTPSQHPADVASDLEQRERLVAQTTADQARLTSIDDALTRLGAGAYGRCVDCGEAIPLERLAALPHAARCIGCQQRDERLRLRYTRR